MNLSQKIRNIFIADILSLLLFVITVYLLYFLYDIIISNAMPLVKQIAKQYNFDFSEYIFPIATLVIVILLIFLIGILTKMYFRKILIKILDNIIAKVPVARSIYNATKQVVDSFKNSTGSSFSKVVLVEFPRRDTWMIAFLVRDLLDFMENASIKEESCNVFYSHSTKPNIWFCGCCI